MVCCNLFKFDCESSNFPYVNHTQICSWHQPVLSNAGEISCTRKQAEPLIELKRMIDLLQGRRFTHCAILPSKHS